MNKIFAYAGSNNGISVFEIDSENGCLKKTAEQFENFNVSCILINKDNNLLYCTDNSASAVLAFQIDRESGLLKFINSQPAFAPNPSCIALSHDEKKMIVTSHSRNESVIKAFIDSNGKWRTQLIYNDSSIVLYPANEDGSIAEASDVINLQKNGMKMPHLDCVRLSPVNDVFIVCDSGSDKIYSLKSYSDRLYLCNGRGFDGVENAGVKCCSFHPCKPFFYVNNENLPFISCYNYNEDGNIALVGDVDSLSVKYKNAYGEKKQADMVISSDGKYLYNLTKGADMISAFKINQKDGTLTLIQCLKLKGRKATSCTVSADDRYFYVGCSDSIEIFKVKDNGHLLFNSSLKTTAEVRTLAVMKKQVIEM